MKFFDRVLRDWRINVSIKHIKKSYKYALDIGCDDGYLLNKLGNDFIYKLGVDPRVESCDARNIKILKGYFPETLEKYNPTKPFDVIFALAVFEHFNESELKLSAKTISKLLSEKGRLIVTVPHPFVDSILDVLMFIKLVDGQAVDEHHGFEPSNLEKYFNEYLELELHKKFQFGLNNLYIFRKK